MAALASSLAVLASRAAGAGADALETRFVALSAIHCGLLLLLAFWLFLGADTRERWDWLAARGQTFLLAALALALMSGVSHAAAEWDSPWTWSVDAAHLVGAGVWAGALPPLALLLRGAPDWQTIRTLRRFSRVALVAMFALTVSGLAGAWLLIGDIPNLVGTTHGRLLLAKLVALSAALLLTAIAGAPPLLSSAAAETAAAASRRLSRLIAAQAVVAMILIGLAASLRTASPALKQTPVWPWATRVSYEIASGASLWRRITEPPEAIILAACVLLLVVALFRLRQRAWFLPASLVALVVAGAGVALRPSMVEAFPTSFARSPISYSAPSIATGMQVYRTHCAACHGTPRFDGAKRNGGPVELLATESALRSAGDLFWLISHGDLAHGMPAFADALPESQRWDLVNFLRALANAGFCAAITSRVGDAVEPENAWLAAPDLAVAVGPLTPKPLRDLRGRRMALVVLYELPQSRARMSELARRYGALSVQGLEIVAVPAHGSPSALVELGQTPPTLFPVVTEQNEAIHAALRLFAPGTAHAELLIDRQGYIRAIWRDATQLPELDFLQAQVETLNAERTAPPPPDDHIH